MPLRVAASGGEFQRNLVDVKLYCITFFRTKTIVATKLFGKFRDIRAKKLRTPQNLPASTSMSPTQKLGDVHDAFLPIMCRSNQDICKILT